MGRRRHHRDLVIRRTDPPVECRPGCGSCCDPVVLRYAQADAWQYDMSDAARRWVAEDLTPMPQGEARAKAPHLFEGSDRPMPTDEHGGPRLFPHVYRCRHFDPDTRLCTAWDDRPPTCSDFPRYGLATTHPAASLPVDCEYRRDQGLPVLPRPGTERTSTP